MSQQIESSEPGPANRIPGWSKSTVGGHTCELFHPQQPNPHGYVVVALHDRESDHLRRDSLLKSCEQFGLPIVAPMTGHSWWADHIVPGFDDSVTPERYVCDHVVPWIESEYGSRPPQLAIFGQGMGGQGALRTAYKYPNTFPVAAAVNPDLDFQRHVTLGDEVLYAMYGEVERARQDTAILHIHPLNWPRHQFFCCDPDDWPIFESVDRLRMKLGSTGVPFECDISKPAKSFKEFLGFKKTYEDHATPMAIQFIAERLEKERLRVV